MDERTIRNLLLQANGLNRAPDPQVHIAHAVGRDPNRAMLDNNVDLLLRLLGQTNSFPHSQISSNAPVVTNLPLASLNTAVLQYPAASIYGSDLMNSMGAFRFGTASPNLASSLSSAVSPVSVASLAGSQPLVSSLLSLPLSDHDRLLVEELRRARSAVAMSPLVPTNGGLEPPSENASMSAAYGRLTNQSGTVRSIAESVSSSTPSHSFEERPTNNKKEEQEQVTAPATDPPRRERPKRPLSAYNIFFKEERVRVLATLEGEVCLTKKGKKSTSRKGKISFENLAKIIGSKWRDLSKSEVEYYKRKADTDMQRYRREMDEYQNADDLAWKQRSGNTGQGGEEDEDPSRTDLTRER